MRIEESPKTDESGDKKAVPELAGQPQPFKLNPLMKESQV